MYLYQEIEHDYLSLLLQMVFKVKPDWAFITCGLRNWVRVAAVKASTWNREGFRLVFYRELNDLNRRPILFVANDTLGCIRRSSSNSKLRLNMIWELAKKIYSHHKLECVTARVCVVICESHWYRSERSRYWLQSSCGFIGEPNISWPFQIYSLLCNCACPWARARCSARIRGTLENWDYISGEMWPVCTGPVPSPAQLLCP
jgi:hypothetical protein